MTGSQKKPGGGLTDVLPKTPLKKKSKEIRKLTRGRAA